MTTPAKDSTSRTQQAERCSVMTSPARTNRVVGIATVIRQPTLRNSSPPIGRNESRDPNTSSSERQQGNDVVPSHVRAHRADEHETKSDVAIACVRPVSVDTLKQQLAQLHPTTEALSSLPPDTDNVKTSPGDVSRGLCPCSASDDLGERLGCYHGNMSQEQARLRLRLTDVGTFLLRDSSQKPAFPYSLTMMTSRGVTSVRIAYTRPWYTLDTDLSVGTGSKVKNRSRLLRSRCVIGLLEALKSLAESDVIARGGADNRQKCVLVESNGRADVELLVTKPLIGRIVSLKTLCCIVINKHSLLPADHEFNLGLFYPHSV